MTKPRKSLPDNVIDFLEYKKQKGLDTGDPSAKALAVKLVDVFEQYGEDSYYNSFIQAVGGDKEKMKLIMPYVTQEMENRGYHPKSPA